MKLTKSFGFFCCIPVFFPTHGAAGVRHADQSWRLSHEGAYRQRKGSTRLVWAFGGLVPCSKALWKRSWHLSFYQTPPSPSHPIPRHAELWFFARADCAYPHASTQRHLISAFQIDEPVTTVNPTLQKNLSSLLHSEVDLLGSVGAEWQHF